MDDLRILTDNYRTVIIGDEWFCLVSALVGE